MFLGFLYKDKVLEKRFVETIFSNLYKEVLIRI